MSGQRRYEVLDTVGVGAMGTVYRARLHGEGDFAKQVALKVLHTDKSDSDDIARRLRDEARILGLLRHRAVVNVDGLVWLAGHWTVVMEFVDGLDLRQLVEESGAMPESCALEVIGEVAGALHVAYHTQGPDGRELKLLHRDIKPANIQVTTAGEVKVLDFGVARADFDAREAKTRSLAFGSLGYVAQERIDGVETAAGDVYSLGVVLVEMLSGERFGQTFLSPKRHQGRLDERCAKLERAGVSAETIGLARSMLAFAHGDRPVAREVERQATAARTKLGGESLRDWAEDRLPSLIKATREGIDRGELAGQELLEEVPRLPEPRPSSGGSSLRWVALGVLLLLFVVVGGGLVVAVGLGGVLAGSWLF